MSQDYIYEAGKKLLCGSYTQYTPSGASNFKKSGRYQKLPQKGAIQYNYLKSQGRIAHVAIVIECEIDYKSRTFSTTTIEGNTSAKTWERNGGMVAIKHYKNVLFDSVGAGSGDHIDGFGIPVFSSDTCSADDFITAAKGEVGYIEKATSYNVGSTDRAATEDEKICNKGTDNYTKYGRWYGQNGVYWCQQFVSWCAWYACKLSRESKWKKDGKYWHYYSSSGVPVKSRWMLIDGRWYVFDGEGRMITGWFKGEDLWYYLNPDDGAMLSGQWLIYKDQWYYLTESGEMAMDVYILDRERDAYCYVDEDGVWNGRYVENPGPGFEIIS